MSTIKTTAVKPNIWKRLLGDGDQVDMAKRFKTSKQAITNWKARGVPVHMVATVEAATGVPARHLRPDWKSYWPSGSALPR